MSAEPEYRARHRMPVDVDAPDKIAYGLTFRQLAILAGAGALFYTAYQGLHRLVPLPVLIGFGVVAAGLTLGLALGRRDGLPLDAWLLHAVRHSRTPAALSPADVAAARPPSWVDTPAKAKRTSLPAPLRLPAQAISDDGDIELGDGHAALVGASTVNLQLRTGGEQAALVDGFGRWLNSLSTPTQIVVAAQPVDLASHATTVAEAANRQPHPALAAACDDHARFLGELAERRDPLRRQVLVVTRTAAGESGPVARRRAEDTVRQLSGLGVIARALDGPAASAALAAAADPYRPPRPGGLVAADSVITGPPPPHRPDPPPPASRGGPPAGRHRR
ncbi:PrgI family protein [Actinoplanes sp. NPDC051475]|uniref:PrgI family protein n=1 Tax=Actinoplanes sp. NPDC051475 TaxID=3157225 RepID=UPI00344EFF62